MSNKEQRPQPIKAEGNANAATSLTTANDCEGKDMTKILSYQERRTFYHLLNAKHPQSAADIVRALGQCDPRTHIKGLRDKGVEIADIWCKCKENGRYKRYYIKNPLTM